LCGGWCVQDFEKGQEIVGTSTDIGSPIYAQRCDQCVSVLTSVYYVIMNPHVQVRLSTPRKLFVSSLPPRFIYDDLLDSRPPNGVLTLVNSLSTKRHRTLHHAETDEEMVRQFVCGETCIINPAISFHSLIKTPMGQNRRVNTSWVDVIGAVSL
jgi:hypothetical protein